MTNKRIVPKDVTDALQKVTFPNKSESIVDLDMVQEIRIAGKRINFSLVFQKNNDPHIKDVVLASEKAIKEHFGKDIEIEDNITVKYIHNMQRPVLPNVKNIIAISSGKGGVGKSTIATNLAVALANSGAKVGLVDADIFGPSIPKMFGAEGERPLGEVIDGREIINPITKFGIKFLSIGFFVDANSALVWRGPMASNALKQLLTEGNWGELDYLLIDLPPGTSDIHLTLMQTVPVTAAIIVTTPQDVALADVIRGNSMFTSKSTDIPVLGLIENMSWFTPEELPNNKYYIFGKDGGKKLADKLELELLAQIPIVQSIRESGDNGTPIASEKNSTLGNSFAELATKVKHLVHLRNIQHAPTQKIDIKRR